MRPAYYCFEHQHDSSRQHPPSQQVKGAEGKEVIQTIRMQEEDQERRQETESKDVT